MSLYDDLSSPPPLGDLTDKLRRATQDPAAVADLRIRLDVHGGLSTERYDLDFEVSPTGVAAIALRDELSAQRLARAGLDLQPADVAQIVSVIDVDGLLAAAQAKPQLPPDSLVGRLTVAIDGQKVQALFMADNEQAVTAGLEPPPAVARIVDAMYAMAERTTGIEGIRP